MKGNCLIIKESKECRHTQTETKKKSTNQKNIKQKNKKSRSVTIGLSTAHISVKTKHPERKKLRSVLPEPEEPWNMDDILEAQQELSVTGHPKNRLYTNSGASVYILFNRELLEGFTQLDWVIKIKTGGKPIHLSKSDHYIRYCGIYHFL